MIVKLFAVRDSDSGVFDGPLPMQTEQLALRKFSDMVQEGNSDVAKHPDKFTLWWVGTWCDSTGTVDAGEGKRCIASAIDFITPDEESE